MELYQLTITKDSHVLYSQWNWFFIQTKVNITWNGIWIRLNFKQQSVDCALWTSYSEWTLGSYLAKNNAHNSSKKWTMTTSYDYSLCLCLMQQILHSLVILHFSPLSGNTLVTALQGQGHAEYSHNSGICTKLFFYSTKIDEKVRVHTQKTTSSQNNLSEKPWNCICSKFLIYIADTFIRSFFFFFVHFLIRGGEEGRE